MSKLLGAAIAAVLWCSTSAQAQSNQLNGSWVPTDLNYGVLKDLRMNAVQSPAEQIAAYGTLGIIPGSVVSSWLQQLISNPSFREGTVRWNPAAAAKCASGTAGCTKSVHVTVLEFDYVNPNGNDCNVSALVAADALIPPQSVLMGTTPNSVFIPQGPVQYQIIKAPNSTAGQCTYVVQYPLATQNLANFLCTQQGNSSTGCFNSPCIPCNANQSFASPANPSGCVATSGIAPALVAAIEGAAMCLASGAAGPFQCQAVFTTNASACSQMHCFPGDAKVLLEGGRQKVMRDVVIGDRVQVVRPDGSTTYDDVYFFGHRARADLATFIQLTLRSMQGSSGKALRSIALSPRHFLPTSKHGVPQFSQAIARRAEDVGVGDTVWAPQGRGVAPFRVVTIQEVVKEGLWAPYTAAGNIVVDGVVASVHSEWILDPLLDFFGRPDLLPKLYQAVLGPVRLAYRVLGPQRFGILDAWLDFGALATSPVTINCLRAAGFFLLIPLAAYSLGQRMGRTAGGRSIAH